MVKALDTEKPYCKRFFTTKEVMKSSYANKCLSEFVSSNTKKFFDRFNIEVDFLETDPATWIENEEYQESAHKCREIRVVNDTVERCVQLFSTYNRLLTKDESQKQYLLHIVKEYHKNYPSAYKSHLL